MPLTALSPSGVSCARQLACATLGVAALYCTVVVVSGTPSVEIFLVQSPNAGRPPTPTLRSSKSSRRPSSADPSASSKAAVAVQTTEPSVRAPDFTTTQTTDDNSRLTTWLLTCLGLLVMLGTAIASLPRMLQGFPSVLSPLPKTLIGDTTFKPEFETVVSPGVTGVAGVYYAPGSEVARRALAAIPALSSWAHWYEVPFWARDGHLHTILASTRRSTPAVVYYRTSLRCPTGGTVTLDQLVDVQPERAKSKADESATYIEAPPEQWMEDNRDRPFLLMVSGLGGGSQDSYVRSMAVTAMKRGWRVGVVNMRGCGNTPLTSPRLFSAYRGSTDDVRLAVAHLRERVLPHGAPVAAIGWSNGATVVNNYLAEQATTHADVRYRLDAAATLGCPLDMTIASANFKRGFNRFVYDRAITKSLLSKVMPYKHLFQDKEIDTWQGGKCTVDVEQLMLSTTIEEIDEHLTRKTFGFDSVADYYTHASSHQRLKDIRVPTLIINALDDPVAPGEGIAYNEVLSNPNLLLAVTAHGGHLGWCEKSNPTDGSKWIEGVSLSFLEAALRP